MIFAGLFVYHFTPINAVVLIGLIMYVVAMCIGIFRCIRIMRKKDISKKSAEYKNAVIGIVVACIILALAVVGILAATMGW